MEVRALFSLGICILVISVAQAGQSNSTPEANPLEVKVASQFSDSIGEQIRSGETRNYSILLQNPTDRPITATITAPGDLSSLIRFEGGTGGRASLKIEPNATVIQRIFITTMPDTLERTYLGDLLISYSADSAETTRRIPVSIVVRSERRAGLLDVKVNVLSGFVREGQPVRFIVGLINFGPKQRYDVNLSYTIRDENDNVVVRKTDTRAIETTLSFVEKVDIPNTTKPGGYVIQADASYSGFTASAIDTFAVQAGVPLGEFASPDPVVIPLLILLVAPTAITIVLAVIVFRLVRKKK